MRKIRMFAHVSLDGVMQHTADENGFAYGDWSAPYRTPEGRDALLAVCGTGYDLLLGRRTYDLWSAYWPKAPASPMADRLHAATKYVVTHRPESLRWGPCVGVGPDVAREVRRMKAEDGPDVIVWGSSTVARVLLDEGLVDELVVVVYPLVLGVGKRLFVEGVAARKLELVSSMVTGTGVVLCVYRVVGEMVAG